MNGMRPITSFFAELDAFVAEGGNDETQPFINAVAETKGKLKTATDWASCDQTVGCCLALPVDDGVTLAASRASSRSVSSKMPDGNTSQSAKCVSSVCWYRRSASGD